MRDSVNNPLMLKGLKSVDRKIIQSNVSLPAKMETIYGMHKLVGLPTFFGVGLPLFPVGLMGVLNSCFQNPSESSA